MNGVKRYNLVLAMELYNELKEVAAKRNIHLNQLIREVIKLGLLYTKLEETGGQLIIKKKDGKQEILLL